MKFTLHVPVEQYGFVALEVEKESSSEVKQAYDAIAQAFKAKSGLPDKEYRQFISNQLAGKHISVEDYEKMSDMQVFAVQVIKRALKRN